MRGAVGGLVVLSVAIAMALGACSSGNVEVGGSALPVISRGQKIDVADHLEAGKHTLFVFGADW